MYNLKVILAPWGDNLQKGGTFNLVSKGAIVTLPYDATQDELNDAVSEILLIGDHREQLARKLLLTEGDC